MDMMRSLSKRRWSRRLTVRTMMVLILILGCGLGWVVHSAKVQRDAVAVIRKAGGTVYYDWDFQYKPNLYYEFTSKPTGRPRAPVWLVDALGPDYFGTVKIVSLGKVKNVDEVMPEIGRLDRLEVLIFYNSGKLTEAGSCSLAGLNHLRFLRFEGTRVTRTILQDVARLRGLERLVLLSPELNDADLSLLKGLTGLTFLRLQCPKLTDTGLAHLAELPNLRYMDLGPCRITDKGLRPLIGLGKLEKLLIQVPDLIDVFFMKPEVAGTQLGLFVNGYGVTEQGVAWLREKMPQLKVYY